MKDTKMHKSQFGRLYGFRTMLIRLSGQNMRFKNNRELIRSKGTEIPRTQDLFVRNKVTRNSKPKEKQREDQKARSEDQIMLWKLEEDYDQENSVIQITAKEEGERSSKAQ